MSLTLYVIIGITCVLSLILTPIVIKFSIKHGFVDIPKDSRRVHSKPMPRIGGVAIVSSMFIGFLIYFLVTKDIPSIALSKKFLGYALGGLSIFLMGLIDDIFTLRARKKFIFQLVAGILVYAFGIRVSGIRIPFLIPETVGVNAVLDFLLTMAWVLSVTNAVNLIDGLDGLADGITIISATSLLIVFSTTSLSLDAIIITAILLGATLGFLPYNFNPAKTFMGDVGSNFLGFTLACVSLMGFAKGYTIIAILTPILALGIPLFDAGFAMVRRFIKGVPLLKPDGGHIHHRLIKRGFSQRQAVLILYSISTILCIISIRVVIDDIWKVVLLIVIFVAFFFVAVFSIIRSRTGNGESTEINKNFSMDEVHDIKVEENKE